MAAAIPIEGEVGKTPVEAIELSKANDKQLAAILNSYMKEEPHDSCKTAPLIAEMGRRGIFPGNVPGLYQEEAIACAITKKDWQEAYRQLVRWEALDDEDGPSAEWAFRLAFVAGRDDDALVRLEKIAALKEPEQLLKLNKTPEVIFGLSREFIDGGNKEKSLRIYAALFGSPNFLKLNSALRSATAQQILEERITNNQQFDAEALLAEISSASSYLTLLAQRKYQQIWPQIERRVGKNLSLILEQNIVTERIKYQSNPADKAARQGFGRALFEGGRFEEVIELAQAVASDTQNWEENDGWLLNLAAYSHDALGNQAAATEILNRIASIKYDPDQNGWLVNFTLNRASRLMGQGRWADALAASEVAAAIVEKSGSAYAKMLVWRIDACAGKKLGENERTAKALEEIEAHQQDSITLAASAYLCIDNRPRAAELMLASLGDETKQDMALRALQKDEFDIFQSDSILPSIDDLLRDEPEISRAFDKLARDIPKEYIPLVGARRAMLKQQRGE